MNHNLEDDDFQFRPLTEGLGFQNKKEAQTSAPKATSFQLSAAVASPELNPPLPRKGYNIPQSPLPEVSPTTETPVNTVDEILKTLNEKRRYDFSEKPRARLSELPKEVHFQNSRWEFAASMLDSMLVIAGTLLCLIVLLVLTKVDLYANLTRPDSAGMVYLSLIALIATVTWIYLVTHHLFLGFTPGEWVFDQRLGRPAEQSSALYAVKAVARATIVIVTGFILFPLLSMIFRKDVLGQILGLELVRKV